MRITRSILTVSGGLIMAGLAPVSFAGGGCYGAANLCNPGINVTASPYVNQPMGINYAQPYDYLTSATYNQAPHMNVTRIETGAPRTTLDQAPGAYWGGCAAGTYCGGPVAAPIAAPAPAAYAPVAYAPTVSAPQTYVASGDYNPSNFASRQYGDASFVPGIAYLPSSYVERGTAERDAAVASTSYRASTSHSTLSASSGTSVGGGWNRVSGPTMIDGMLATEILCKDEAPAPVAVPQYQVQTQAYRVVRPIVAVPYPVPVECRAPQQNVNVRNVRQGGFAAPVAAGRYTNDWAY